MAYRAFTVARLAKNFKPSRALQSSIFFQRPVLTSYHTAKSDPPLPIPTDDFRNAKNTEWPQDGYELGDYPNLPNISYQRRQPLGWWDNQDRRNFNEPIPEEEDMMNIWVIQEVECNDRYTKYEALGQLLTGLSLLGFVFFLSYLYGPPSAAVPREFPFNNLYLERGGDPNKDPAEDKGTVPNTLCGM